MVNFASVTLLMQRLFLTRDHLGTKEDLLPSMIAKHMGWCAISRLQLLWFAVRDGSQQDSPVPMSSSTASHHSRATADEGQPEAGRRQRALPDGRQNQCCRDLVACRHLSGTSTCEDRHFQDSQGQERPEVGRSTVVHYWDGRVWAAFASVKPATYFIGNTDPLQKSLPRPLRKVDRAVDFSGRRPEYRLQP